MAEDKDKPKPEEKPPKVDDARKHVLGGGAGRAPGKGTNPPYSGKKTKPKKTRE